MEVLDFFLRVIFIQSMLVLLILKVIPLMIKDMSGMFKEFFKPEIQSGKAKIKSFNLRSRTVNKPSIMQKPSIVQKPVYANLRNTIR